MDKVDPSLLRLPLLEAGAEVNFQRQRGTTVLDNALRQNNEEIAEILRQAGGLTQEELAVGRQ